MNFEYFAPTTLEEAQSLLRQPGKKIRMIAGGTDLFLKLKDRLIETDWLVDITRIQRLDYICEDENQGLRIGATTSIRALEKSTLIQKKYAPIFQAARLLGSIAIRNVGTIGGNLCNGAPSAEMAPVLIGLSARAKILTLQEEKILPLEDFFIGPGQTVLAERDLLTEIQVPPMPQTSEGVYLKHADRGSIDLAVVGVAAILILEKGICRDVKIVLGAVAPKPVRAKKAEEILLGKPIEDNQIEKASKIAAEESKPISDVRASAAYRREIVEVLTRKAIREAIAALSNRQTEKQ
jgi:carbon-monoxide dehydrogenase medium subunit